MCADGAKFDPSRYWWHRCPKMPLVQTGADDPRRQEVRSLRGDSVSDVGSVLREMVAKPPRGQFKTKLENIADALDAYDEFCGREPGGEMQDDLRRWNALLLEARLEATEGQSRG